jgi:hypothetical protein
MRKTTSTIALFACLLLCAGVAEAKKKHHPRFTRTDPVVMTGAELPRLLGGTPGDLAAYRYTPAKGRRSKGGGAGAGKWVAIPVQVDERAVVDFGSPASGPGVQGTVYGSAPIGATALQYTDPNTFVGPDPDPTIDPNDEVAFMASDAGAPAPKGMRFPKGTRRAGATRVSLTDPVSKAKASIYLFPKRRPATQPADYVKYDFRLLSGPYKQTYKRTAGPNPEASTISTKNYTAGFSDRWYFDQLAISAGGANGADILDGYKFAFAPGNCGRSEATFNAGEGAFAVNKDGPVRAIRSYVGANSGPDTERTDIFYANRHDIVTDLRVHPIPSLFTQYDMSPAAIGMTYYDEQHQGGVPVDGVPDTLSGSTPSSWHLWAGGQGSLFADDSVRSTFAAAFLGGATAFYSDDSTPSVTQCWGDSQQIGSAGLSSAPAGGIPATAPGSPDSLQAVSTDLMLAPNEIPSRAAILHELIQRHIEAQWRRVPRPRRFFGR